MLIPMNSKLRIGLVVMEFLPDPIGGIGSFAQELSDGLAQMGHNVTVVIPNLSLSGKVKCRTTFLSEEMAQPRPGVSVHRWNFFPPAWLRWRPGVLWHRWQLKRKISMLHHAKPFDVLETQDLYGPLPFGGLRNVPTVVRHHSSATFYDGISGSSGGDSLTYWLERQTARRTRHHVAVSHFVGHGVQACFDLRPEDITAIPYGIDTHLFRPASPGGVEPIPGRIVFVNSVGPRKGVRQLCLAFEQVMQQVPHASLQLVGRKDRVDADGRLYADACLDGVSATTRSRIEFTGTLDRQTELVPVLQKATVCCFPSQLETFGIAPLEAMACGKPVIYMNHGPGPEIIRHGVNGLLCDTSSPEDIASKLIQILTRPLMASELGVAARLRALDYSKEKWIEKNLEYYRGLKRR